MKEDMNFFCECNFPKQNIYQNTKYNDVQALISGVFKHLTKNRMFFFRLENFIKKKKKMKFEIKT